MLCDTVQRECQRPWPAASVIEAISGNEGCARIPGAATSKHVKVTCTRVGEDSYTGRSALLADGFPGLNGVATVASIMMHGERN